MWTIWKKVGQTPLQALLELKKKKRLSESVPMTYAGRLDPLAEGKLIILAGNECKNKAKYLKLDKEYIFEVFLGASSDTGDIMGIIEEGTASAIPGKGVPKDLLKNILKQYEGRYVCEYPAFSSKTATSPKTGETKPLFLWALEGKINEIKLPKKEVEIYKLEFLGMRFIDGQTILQEAINKIEKVPEVKDKNKRLGADFRRKEVKQSWRRWLHISCASDYKFKQRFTIIKLRCICSSGTYIRTLSRDIASKFGVKGLSWSIKRTKIGKYKKFFGNFGFWLKTY